MTTARDRRTVYDAILERIFFAHHETGAISIPFERREIIEAASDLGLAPPKNIGDVVYSSRYRAQLPSSIQSTADESREWIIAPAGRSVYEFRQVRFSTISPNRQLLTIKVPDATPGVINMYALGDEQALLSKLRYNRLIDIFTRSTCYSLQNHLRTSIEVWNPIRERWDGTQVETDEIYVSISANGVHSCVPVEAKGVQDSHNVIQMWQNARVAKSKYPHLPVRCIAAQSLADGAIALMEVRADDFDDLAVVQEAHYSLVSPSEMTTEDLVVYQNIAERD